MSIAVQKSPRQVTVTIEQLEEMATGQDVSSLVQKHFPDLLAKDDPKVLEVVRKGYRSEALHWLKMADKKNMHIGRFTKEKRLQIAEVYAKHGETTLKRIAEEEHLEYLLVI